MSKTERTAASLSVCARLTPVPTPGHALRSVFKRRMIEVVSNRERRACSRIRPGLEAARAETEVRSGG